MNKPVTCFISAVTLLVSGSLAVLLMSLSEDPLLHDAYSIQAPVICLMAFLLMCTVLLQYGSTAARRVLTGLFASASGVFAFTAMQLLVSTSLPAASIALPSLIGLLLIIPAMILAFSSRLDRELEATRRQISRIPQQADLDAARILRSR